MILLFHFSLSHSCVLPAFCSFENASTRWFHSDLFFLALQTWSKDAHAGFAFRLYFLYYKRRAWRQETGEVSHGVLECDACALQKM